MRFFRLLLATLWLLALGVAAAPAHAATISVSPPRWTNRAADRLINKFNRQDCINEPVVEGTFSVSVVQAPTNALFQVWSGTGCDQYANRSPTAVSRTCTAITEALYPRNGDVVIKLRDMLAAYGATVDGSVGECDATTTAGLQTRSLYFVVSDPATNATVATGTNSTWAFTYDIKAPPPPTSVKAGSGDETLVTTFTAPDGETNLLHYKFYCSLISDSPVVTTDASGTGGTTGTDSGGTSTGATAGTEAGGAADTGTSGTSGTTSTAGTAGTTTTTPVDVTCQSSVLIPGQPVPDSKDVIDCGEIAAQGATGGETNPVLTNDIKYAVAIATEDNVNNIGVLSALACNVPKDTTGFIEAYGEAGGRAGGGFCTFAPARHGAFSLLVAFVIGACALVRRRK